MIWSRKRYEGLTIRKLADSRHCADVGLLLLRRQAGHPDRVAEDSFLELARRSEMRRTADPMESLRFGLREYVAFGLENANEYRTIFMTAQLHEHRGEKFEELEAQNPAFQGSAGREGVYRR